MAGPSGSISEALVDLRADLLEEQLLRDGTIRSKPNDDEVEMDFSDFTEAGFYRIVRALNDGGYAFAQFGDLRKDRHVLFRHDVDYSVHRASALAAIEADAGARATYFVMTRSRFYNLLEPDCLRALWRIRSLGHWIGLHFDTEVYNVPHWQHEQLRDAIDRERSILELAIESKVSAVSYHNPTMSNVLDFDQEEIACLANAYSKRLREDYVYCSDSNGIWRFAPMPDVIRSGHERLHLLTHPAWWTPQPMAPSERIDRAISGRAAATRCDYDKTLEQAGRPNIRASD